MVCTVIVNHHRAVECAYKGEWRLPIRQKQSKAGRNYELKGWFNGRFTGSYCPKSVFLQDEPANSKMKANAY